MPETTLMGLSMLIPKAGDIPAFGNVRVTHGMFNSEVQRELDATDTLFEDCIFYGLTLKNPRGCIRCISRPYPPSKQEQP